jgi:hypothetical protein
MSKRIIVLSADQADELAALLWECCTETEEGVKTLREDLPLTDIWRAVVNAKTEHDLLKSI